LRGCSSATSSLMPWMLFFFVYTLLQNLVSVHLFVEYTSHGSLWEGIGASVAVALGGAAVWAAKRLENAPEAQGEVKLVQEEEVAEAQQKVEDLNTFLFKVAWTGIEETRWRNDGGKLVFEDRYLCMTVLACVLSLVGTTSSTLDIANVYSIANSSMFQISRRSIFVGMGLTSSTLITFWLFRKGGPFHLASKFIFGYILIAGITAFFADESGHAEGQVEFFWFLMTDFYLIIDAQIIALLILTTLRMFKYQGLLVIVLLMFFKSSIVILETSNFSDLSTLYYNLIVPLIGRRWRLLPIALFKITAIPFWYMIHTELRRRNRELSKNTMIKL